MRKLFVVLILAVATFLTDAKGDIWGDYITVSAPPGSSGPGGIISGAMYDIYAEFTSDGGDTSLYIYKNGSYYTQTSDYTWGTATLYCSTSSTDYGNQTIRYSYSGYQSSESSLGSCYGQTDVQIYVPNHAPTGSFDGVSNVTKGQNISASGWAVDYERGAPVDHVDYYVDGNYAGLASLSGYRPDLQSANVSWGFWSPNDVTWSGWNISYNTGALPIGDHTMRIVVWDDQGLSADLGTKTFAVAPIPQSITFNNPGTQTYGTALALNASASSGLPVSYSISGPAYLSGNALYFTSPGAVTVTASQAGSSDYSAAADVSQSFTVNPLSQSITFYNPGTQTYGGSVTLNASSSSGLSVSYSVSGPANLSGNTVYFIGTGTVSITASQSGNTYYSAAANVVQSFAVNPQSTSFSISNTSFTYDGQTHSPTITANPGGASYVLGGIRSGTSAGDYTVTATATGNYSGSASFNWAIGQQSQSISFPNPGSQTYGTPLNLNATASSGLTVSYSVSGPASLSGNTLTFTGTGSVTVTASQGGNQNYSAASTVSQTFTVNAQPTTFSLNTMSFTYNGSAQGPSVIANPSGASYSVSGTSSATNFGTYNVTVTATGNYSGSANLSWYIAATGQTITFNQPADQTYGDTLTLNATASSGLPVTYSVASGPATVSGNVVSFTGCGAVTITVSQAGNANYSSAPNVNRTFTVNPRSATFALSSTSFTYNGSEQGPSVVATPSGATYSVSSGTLSAVGGGTYAVTITATGNYTGSSSLSWTIDKTSQSITFANPGTQNAGASLTLNATASSGLAVNYTVSGPVSLNGNVATFIKGGTATITASQPGDANYNAANDVTVSFTVIRDPNADDDGDGISNGMEALLGTNPDGPASTDTPNSNQLKINTPSK